MMTKINIIIAIFVVTGYCPCKKCCGPYARGVTANGSKAVGRLIAAPKSIPFGTSIYVPGYGKAIVKDRGGAIQGSRLDILFPTHQQAINWGKRRLEVKISR